MRDVDRNRLRAELTKQFVDLLVYQAERQIDKQFPSGQRDYDMEYFVEQFVDKLRAKLFP
jgi:hypothetical protein